MEELFFTSKVLTSSAQGSVARTLCLQSARMVFTLKVLHKLAWPGRSSRANFLKVAFRFMLSSGEWRVGGREKRMSLVLCHTTADGCYSLGEVSWKTKKPGGVLWRSVIG